LHFAEKTAFFALDTVHETGNVVDVLLIEVDLGVLFVEEGFEFLVKGSELIVLELGRQITQKLCCQKILSW
jgi:hypothetical protein